MNRYFALMLSVALPFALSVFMGAPRGELDFWALWLIAMALLGLPILALEMALGLRANGAPYLVGVQALTRESGVSMRYRLFAWLWALLPVALGVGLLLESVGFLHAAFSRLGIFLGIPALALAFVLAIAVLIVSFFGVYLLPLAVLGLVGGALLGMGHFAPQFALTSVSLSEWARAVFFALLGVGVGSGFYWQKSKLPRPILTTWAVQLTAGACALILGAPSSALGMLVWALGGAFLSAALLHFAKQELLVRLGLIKSHGIWLTVFLLMFLAMVFLPRSVVVASVGVLALTALFVVCVFAGYQMKMSHLRKTLFLPEWLYLIWRVVLRLVVPLACFAALIGWFL